MNDLPSRRVLHHSFFFYLHLQLEKQLLNQARNILGKVFMKLLARAFFYSFIHFNYQHSCNAFLRQMFLYIRVSKFCKSAKTIYLNAYQFTITVPRATIMEIVILLSVFTTEHDSCTHSCNERR